MALLAADIPQRGGPFCEHARQTKVVCAAICCACFLDAPEPRVITPPNAHRGFARTRRMVDSRGQCPAAGEPYDVACRCVRQAETLNIRQTDAYVNATPLTTRHANASSNEAPQRIMQANASGNATPQTIMQANASGNATPLTIMQANASVNAAPQTIMQTNASGNATPKTIINANASGNTAPLTIMHADASGNAAPLTISQTNASVNATPYDMSLNGKRPAPSARAGLLCHFMPNIFSLRSR